MDMAEFRAWKSAFADFIACAQGPGALEACSAGWLKDAARWIGPDTSLAGAMALSYAGRIRSGKLDGYCSA